MFRRALAVAFLVWVSAPAAFAAQNAMVTVEQAPIRERPSLDAKIIESKAAGTKIRVSSYNKDGWYKTKAATGQFGWIWQADLTVLTYSSDVNAANLDMKEHRHDRRSRREKWLFLRAGGGLFPIVSADLSDRLGLGKGHWYFALGGFFETAVRLEDRLRLAFRVFTYGASSSASFFNTNYDISMSGTPLMLGLDADVTRTEHFDITAGFYLGMSSNQLSVKASSFAIPNAFVLKNTTFAVLVNFAAKYHFSNWFSVVGELGLYYSQIKGTVPNTFNGDSPFREAGGGLSKLQVNQTGPIMGLGVQFAI